MPTRPEPSVAAPAVGDCWFEPDYGSAPAWSWWKGEPAVDCGLEHNSITIAVGDLGEEFSYAPVDGALELTDEQIGLVHQICTPDAWQGVGTNEGSRVVPFWYLPTPREWSAGARWVRCDVALAALGPLSPVTLEPLTGSADDLRSGIADTYRLCLDTPHPAYVYGPWYDPEGNVAVPCEGLPQWELGLRLQLPEGPFPGEEALDATAHTACQDVLNARAGDRWGARSYHPDEQGWLRGGRSVVCWLR